MKNKNYIAEFMKDNGLEVGEEFEVELKGDVMHFTKDYTLFSKNDKSRAYELGFLLTGNAQIKKFPKVPKQEYVEVTNEVPRFTEIEVRDSDVDVWIKATFVFKTEAKNDKYCYGVLDEGGRGLRYFVQARMLKPSEPEFKEGELIEVSNDGDYWCKREFVRSEETIVTTVNDCGIEESNWKWIRKIEGK